MTSSRLDFGRPAQAALLVKEARLRNQDLIITFPKPLRPFQDRQTLVVSADDLKHFDTETAFIWWHVREYHVGLVTWRRAATKYARRTSKAFVVHADCSITAIRNECSLTFIRPNGFVAGGGIC